MNPAHLPSYPFRISYGPKDDRLADFYLPALERTVRFDSATGFFSSASLAIAAAGIVRLIGNGGKMRLLCGAQLSPADVLKPDSTDPSFMPIAIPDFSDGEAVVVGVLVEVLDVTP